MSVDVWGLGLTAHELMRGARLGIERVSESRYKELLLRIDSASEAAVNNDVPADRMGYKQNGPSLRYN